MDRTIINVDIGSSNLKLTVFSYEGAIVRFDKIATPYVCDLSTSFVEMQPEEVLKAVGTLLERSGRKKDETVLAMTITGMAKSELAVDENGIPLCNSISWMDNRCTGITFPAADAVKAELQHDPVSTTYLPFRNHWVKEHCPEIADRIACWVNITDYIQARLVGSRHMTTDFSEACRSLVYDSLSECWNEKLLGIFEVEREKLPQVLPSGTLLGEIAENFGLGAGVKLFKGGHDHMCASKAACLHQMSVPLLSTGTSEMIVVPLKEGKQIRLDHCNIDHQVNPKRWALVGAVARSGDSLKWANGLFGLYEIEKEAKLLECYLKRADSLPFYIPAAVGSDPSQTGAFWHLSNRTDAYDMALAVIEGVCFESRTVAEKMSASVGYPFTKYRLVGGFAGLENLLSFKSSVLEAPLEVYPDVDMASLGGFLICREGLDGRFCQDELAEKLLESQRHFVRMPDTRLSECMKKRYNEYLLLRKKVTGKEG